VAKRVKREPGWFRHSAAVRKHIAPVPPDLPRGRGGVWAITMVKDEADIIETVVRHLLAQGIERVLVADNLSSDGTEAILGRLARTEPVTVLTDRLTQYFQAEKMTHLARQAARAGAGWVLPFDADEIWLAPEGTLASWLGRCPADVVQATVFNHVPTPHDDESEPDPVRRLRWRKRDPNRLHKVAFRAHRRARLAYGNHGVTRRGGRTGGLQVRHFPYRSEEQFIRKFHQGAQSFVGTGFGPDKGRVWRGLGSLDTEGLRAAWRTLVETQNLPIDWMEMPREGLVDDPAPLQRLDPTP